MTRIICGEWPAASKRAAPTIEAEAGLEIKGEPCYFYVMQPDEQYGLVVFLLTEMDDAQWPAAVYGATPFDSGGWWHGRIETNPSLGRAARCERFKSIDVPLQRWQSAYNCYVANNTTMLNYIMGRPPAKHASAVAEIVLAAPNSAKAWKWEVRIPPSLIASRVRLHSAYMGSQEKADYIDWIENDFPEPDRRYSLTQWVNDNVHPVPASVGAGGSEVVKVVKSKLVESAGGAHGG